MTQDSRIYLDNNSTTGLDPMVFKAMQYDLCSIPRNPSSIHSFGRDARNELTRAKRTIAESFKVMPDELLFSSGATESNNHLLRGFLKAVFPKTVITTKLEHISVYKLIQEYEESGGDVLYLETGENGCATPDSLQNALTPNTALIVLMAVNNETGVKTDYKKVAELAHLRQIPFVMDAVALLGKEPFEIVPGVAAASFSGHKLHAPKGVGITYLNSQYELPPLIAGGGQQMGMRSGTYNLSGIIGFSKAIELLDNVLFHSKNEMEKLRDYFEQSLLEKLSDVVINGDKNPRICNTSNIAFLGLDGESLLMNLDLKGLAASHGSACSSGSLAPSRILSEMGYSKKRVESSIRFSLSRFTTSAEIDHALSIIVDVVCKMRSIL